MATATVANEYCNLSLQNYANPQPTPATLRGKRIAGTGGEHQDSRSFVPNFGSLSASELSRAF